MKYGISMLAARGFIGLWAVTVVASGGVSRWAAAAAPYSQTWSGTDTEGWEGNTTSSEVVHDGTSGNPAGSIVTRRSLSPPVFDIGATSGTVAETSGSFSGSPWTVSFDLLLDTGKFSGVSLRYRYQGPTFNGWSFPFAGPFDDYNVWKNYSVTFDPAWTDAQAMAQGWVQEAGPVESFATTLADAYRTEIRLIMADDLSAIAHIDNFVQRAVPEPTGVALALLSLAGLGVLRRRTVDI